MNTLRLRLNVFELEKYSSIKEICFIPLAWNFFDEIYKRIKLVRHNTNDIYLKYFPKIKIIKENFNNAI